MRCTCGHLNPDENRYCGMCGAPLLVKPAEHTYVASEEQPRRPVERPQREPQPIPPAIAEATRFSEYPARNNWNGRQAEVDEPDEEPLPRNGSATTVSGPSFLGLSGNEGDSSVSGYSYLFQDEPEKSHAGLYVFLAVLLIGGAVLYWKWQPIRDYVVSTAIAHSQKPKPAAQEQAAAPVAEDAGHTPAPPVDVAPTPLKPEPKAAPTTDTSGAEKNAASSANTPSDNATTDKKTAATDQPATAAAETTPPPSAKAPRSTRAASSEGTPPSSKAADSEEATASSGKKARAASSKPEPARPQAVPGAELVQAGERFLYGRGVPRNCSQAVTYFRAAAGQKNPQAYSQLGALYATGECVPMDRAQAYSWFSRALAAQRNSNPYIERNLTMLWRDMTPQERQRVAGKSY